MARLADEGMPSRLNPSTGTREYKYPAFQVWYYQKLRDMAAADALAKYPKADSPESAKARLANAQADMVEFELARKRSEFIAVGDHMRQYQALAERLVEPTKRLKSEFLEPLVTHGVARDHAEQLLERMEDWLRSQFHAGTADYEEPESDEPTDDE